MSLAAVSVRCYYNNIRQYFLFAGRRNKSVFQFKKSYFEIPAFQSHIDYAGI